ncbi:MAG: alanine racemase [Alphaproteobacteria bacterium]|nr:alanine racemase [Alphaproteobacteria bacterium]
MNPTLTIDLSALSYNFRSISGKAGLPRVACVVKNNAYGLGAVPVVEALYAAGCRAFFVAYPDEGAEIRPAAPDAAVYVLQGFDATDAGICARSRLIPVLSNKGQWDAWRLLSPHAERPAIQVETGLNRLGFSYDELAAMPEQERRQFGLVLSHLACADEPDHPMNRRQRDNLIKIKPLFKDTPFSLSASDGFYLGPDFHFDLVRIGASLYGLNPVAGRPKENKNVIGITASVIHTHTIQAGETAGYGAAFIAARPTTLATISIGYGDGIFRSFSPKGKVFFDIDGKRSAAPLAGRVSMDNITADVTDVPGDVLGKRAVILDAQFDCDDMARCAGTIGYEVLNAVGHGIRYRREWISEK